MNRARWQAASVMFASAQRWLLELSEQASMRGDSTDLTSLMQLLIGGWLCEHMVARKQTSELWTLMRQVEDRLHREVANGTFNGSSYNAKLLFLIQGILRTRGFRAFGIEEFALAVAEALAAYEAVPARYGTEAWLLSQLGYDLTPPLNDLTWTDLRGGPLALLRAEREQLKSACLNLCAATQYGRLPPSASPEVGRDAEDVLAATLVQSAREYDLEIVALLLRSIIYLRPSRRSTLELGVDFLMQQQRADGRFGFLAVEAEKLAERAHCATFAVDERLYLPLTISCLWSLAEAFVPTFNLLSSVAPARCAREVQLERLARRGRGPRSSGGSV